MINTTHYKGVSRAQYRGSGVHSTGGPLGTAWAQESPEVGHVIATACVGRMCTAPIPASPSLLSISCDVSS